MARAYTAGQACHTRLHTCMAACGIQTVCGMVLSMLWEGVVPEARNGQGGGARG